MAIRGDFDYDPLLKAVILAWTDPKSVADVADALSSAFPDSAR